MPSDALKRLAGFMVPMSDERIRNIMRQEYPEMYRVSDIKRQRWIEVNGSIFVEAQHEVKPNLGKPYKTRLAIAFNVGEVVAKHIVKLHNDDLEK